jgi:hypothetical protein
MMQSEICYRQRRACKGGRRERGTLSYNIRRRYTNGGRLAGEEREEGGLDGSVEAAGGREEDGIVLPAFQTELGLRCN